MLESGAEPELGVKCTVTLSPIVIQYLDELGLRSVADRSGHGQVELEKADTRSVLLAGTTATATRERSRADRQIDTSWIRTFCLTGALPLLPA